ncbi:MAG: DUF3748 domain-containing protein, partial [Chitinophagaceae bacterium]
MTDQPIYHEIQLTSDLKGHCLNSTQCFSADGKMIVYDTRNVDSALASNGEIRIFNIETLEDRLVYKTENQTAFGPGVGAVTFSPVANRVLFLAGIRNADESNPYSITRRTGFAVDVSNEATQPVIGDTGQTETVVQPNRVIRMDARDIVEPYTPGALRGGTHAHTWSGDGQWVSFTYNDHVLHKAAINTPDSNGSSTTILPQADPAHEIIDTRTVGVMFPGSTQVAGADDVENINGTMFSVLVTKVVKRPKPGTDEISRAFDE